MRKFRKLLAAVLAGIMVIGAMAVSAFADGGAYTAKFEGQFDISVAGNFAEWEDTSAWNCTFDKDGLATYTADFGQEVKFAGNYVGLSTDVPYDEDMAANFISIKFDGVEVPFTDAFLSDEGIDGGLRLTLTNQWNSDITTQPVDPAVYADSFQTVEIQFYVGDYTPAAGDASYTALVFVAVAALAVVATVSVKRRAVER